jgi:hypothetical protein
MAANPSLCSRSAERAQPYRHPSRYKYEYTYIHTDIHTRTHTHTWRSRRAARRNVFSLFEISMLEKEREEKKNRDFVFYVEYAFFIIGRGSAMPISQYE